MTKINSHPTQQKEAQLLDVVTHFYVKKKYSEVKPSSMALPPILIHVMSFIRYKNIGLKTPQSILNIFYGYILSPWFSFDMVQTPKKVSSIYAPHNNDNGCLPNNIRFQ